MILFDRYFDYLLTTTPKDSSIIVVIDSKEKNATLYSNPPKTYDLVTEGESYKDGYYDLVKWAAIDGDGVKSYIRIMHLDEKYFLYIDYKGITYLFFAVLQN